MRLKALTSGREESQSQRQSERLSRGRSRGSRSLSGNVSDVSVSARSHSTSQRVSTTQAGLEGGHLEGGGLEGGGAPPTQLSTVESEGASAAESSRGWSQRAVPSSQRGVLLRVGSAAALPKSPSLSLARAMSLIPRQRSAFLTKSAGSPKNVRGSGRGNGHRSGHRDDGSTAIAAAPAAAPGQVAVETSTTAADAAASSAVEGAPGDSGGDLRVLGGLWARSANDVRAECSVTHGFVDHGSVNHVSADCSAGSAASAGETSAASLAATSAVASAPSPAPSSLPSAPSAALQWLLCCCAPALTPRSAQEQEASALKKARQSQYLFRSIERLDRLSGFVLGEISKATPALPTALSPQRRPSDAAAAPSDCATASSDGAAPSDASAAKDVAAAPAAVAATSAAASASRRSGFVTATEESNLSNASARSRPSRLHEPYACADYQSHPGMLWVAEGHLAFSAAGGARVVIHLLRISAIELPTSRLRAGESKTIRLTLTGTPAVHECFFSFTDRQKVVDDIVKQARRLGHDIRVGGRLE